MSHLHKTIAGVISLLTASIHLYSQGNPADLVPAPQEYSVSEGVYTIPADGPRFVISKKNVQELPDGLPDFSRKGAYRLEVRRDKVLIRSATEEGIFYAKQTFSQMTDSTGNVVCCTILDYPRFRWRGILVDISRFFLSPEFLKRQMDVMASLKMNVMHIHLTDDGGWRFGAESMSDLISTSAWRLGNSWKEWGNQGYKYATEGNPIATGGYLSEKDMRDLVAYAAERHITLVPEVDFPGHSDPVLITYPNLRCLNPDGTPRMETHELCLGNPETYAFVKKLIDALVDIFPSQYIHIGGDEANTAPWEACPRCQAVMQREGLKNGKELQNYFERIVVDYVKSKGRKAIGWNESVEEDAPKDLTMTAWNGTAIGPKIAASGRDVVMSPNTKYYLDYVQDAPMKEQSPMGSYLPIDSVYTYEPLEGVADQDTCHVLGVQGNLWTEHVDSPSRAEYLLYPRALAVAEVGWSSADRNLSDFRRRAQLFCSNKLKEYTYFDLSEEIGERPKFFTPVQHLAVGAQVKYNKAFCSRFPGSGNSVLADGLLGGWSFETSRWNGFDTDMDVTLDLGSSKPIHSVEATFMGNRSVWIAVPESIEVFVSDDGMNFRAAGKSMSEVYEQEASMVYFPIRVNVNEEARYVRVLARKKSGGLSAYMFTDEIIIN